ncbi:type IV secretion system protein [Salmonella enterica]|nr:type IV secretion system protein [Salmonella enterica]
MNNKIKEHIETAKSFEKQIQAENEKSKKVAWRVAAGSSLLTLCLGVAVSVLAPLKETELAIVSVDNTTGRTELITQVNQEKILQSEALGRHFVSTYITLREGYNYPSLQNDYETVQLYSSNTVKDGYLRLFDGDYAPDKIYNNNGSFVSVEIISNIISDATAPDKLSTVRFKKTVRNFRTGQVSSSFWTARVTYHFEPSKPLLSSSRDLNPLGFTVTSYQTDQEIRGE